MHKPLQRPAAGSAGRAVHTVHNWLRRPFVPGFRRSSMKARSAPCGRFAGGPCARNRRSPSRPTGQWRADPAVAGGGILFDHGWHALYCVVRWLGVPGAVSAILEKSAVFANGRSKILRP